VEEHVLIQSVLFLLILRHIFLRHDIVQKCDEFDSHVWIVDSSIQNHFTTSSQLQMHILICSDIDFGIELFEERWERIEIRHYQLRQDLEIHSQWFNCVDICVDGHLIQESVAVCEVLWFHSHLFSGTNVKDMCEREKLPIKLVGLLSVQVSILAKFISKLNVKLLIIFFLNRFIKLFVVSSIKFFKFLS
jgi:hypothetical protein